MSFTSKITLVVALALSCLSAFSQSGNPRGGGSGGNATNAQPPSAVLTNISATGVSPGATNASAYVGSSSGNGTNLTIKSNGDTVPLTIRGSSSQTVANLLAVQDFGLNTYFSVTAAGFLEGFGGAGVRLAPSTTPGYVWTATAADSTGSFQPPAGTNAVLSNIIGTGALTNKWNSWQVYGSPTVSNSMFAANRGLGIVTNSTDFSSLMMSIANRGTEGFDIEILPNPYYSNSYSASSTITITNWGIIRGSGNPTTVIRATAALNGPIFQIGTATISAGGINRFKDLRLEGDNAGTNGVGILIVNCAEPVFRDIETTGFKKAGIEFASTNIVNWAYADHCWFVTKHTGAKGVLISGNVGSAATDAAQNHFEFNDCNFGSGGGEAILVTGNFPNLRVIDSVFKFASGSMDYGISQENGRGAVYRGNKFVNFGGASPIFFAYTVTPFTGVTNLNPTFQNNSSDGTSPIISIGQFVTNVVMSGNSIRGTGDVVFYENEASNGQINNFDPREFRLGSLATNSIPYIAEYGKVRALTVGSGLTLTAGTLSSSGGTGGGTNSPNINLLGQGTTATLVAGTDKSFLIETNGSFNLNVSLAVPVSGQRVSLTVSNRATTAITWTFYTNSVASQMFDLASKTNITAVPVPAGSSVESELTWVGSYWRRTIKGEPLGRLVASTGITITTNVGVNGLDVLIASTGGGGGAGSLPMNANQFNTNGSVSIIDGALLTNQTIRGVTFPTLTASRPLILNASGNVTNATGTPDGTKFLRDDGVLAAAGSSTSVQVTNVSLFTSASTNLIIDLGLASTNHVNFKIGMLTNSHIVFSNKTLMKFPVDIYWQQDTNGNRSILSMAASAGGVIQTNGFITLTTNASAMDVWTVKDSFNSTNTINLSLHTGHSGALLTTSTNLLVVGTRYTNGPLRTMVSASFTLTATATGVATVSLFVERAGVTNSLQISAGPLAALVTIEPLIQLVGPGETYYFTDESASGGSVAIVPKTSSKVDLQ